MYIYTCVYIFVCTCSCISMHVKVKPRRQYPFPYSDTICKGLWAWNSPCMSDWLGRDISAALTSTHSVLSLPVHTTWPACFHMSSGDPGPCDARTSNWLTHNLHSTWVVHYSHSVRESKIRSRQHRYYPGDRHFSHHRRKCGYYHTDDREVQRSPQSLVTSPTSQSQKGIKPDPISKSCKCEIIVHFHPHF